MLNKLVGMKGFDYVVEVESTRIPYPVFMGQHEETRRILALVNRGDKEGSWNIAEEENRPSLGFLQSSNP